SGEWSGDLFSVQLDLANEQLGARDWSAGDILKTMDPTTDRVILTTKADTRTGVAFDWGELSTGVGSQQEMLDADPDTGNPDGLGPQRVSFLRGDHSDEIDATAGTGIFRTRDDGFVLGDIVNSGPVFVGAPPFLYPDDLENPTALTRRYSQFRGNNNNRTPVVYVGANDGMFHGFNADTGREVLAYVPTSVYPKLNQLTDSGYSHRYYVDGSPTYGDAFFSGDWQSVIVGTLAGGGQAVFALDVTNPSSFSELSAGQTVLWEFTDADDPDLGFTYGPAVIAKTHDGGKWAVFLGNGYNNTQADGNASTTGNAVLYVLFIEDGTDGTWTLNSDYIKIDTGKGMATSADLSTPNGLASPAVIDADGDFIADFVFAGDLQGNMWKFDVRNSDSSTWDLAPGSVPLFTATDDSSGQPQPITVQPEVLNHPTGEGGFMVYFGTGKYIENADNVVAGGAQTQTFYGIWDQLGTDPSSHSTVDKNKLRTQALTTDTAGGQTVRVFDNPQPITAWGTGAGEHMGWRVHLPELGERNVTNPAVIADRMLFTTLIPLESPCDFGGTGFLMELSIVDGGPPPESVFDITDDDFFDTNDLSDRGLVVVGVNPDIGILPQPAVLAGGGSGAGGGGGGGECFYAKIEAGTKDVDAGAVIKNKCPDTPLANRRSWRQLR
ncbi:MAG: pilus assembly protein, partial [Acidiferrobacterales bacterium]